MRGLRYGLVALAAVYPAVVVLLAGHDGLLISQDSVSYLAGAESFAQGRGLLSFDGEPLTLFPPGLSVLLGLFVAAGLPLAGSALILNAVLATGIVLGTYLVARWTLESSWGAVAAVVGTSLSTSYLATFTYLWSEPLFTALVVALVLVLLKAVRRGDGSWWLVGASGVVTSLAVSVRYVGLVLLAAVALGLWWGARTLGRGPAALRVVAGVLIGLSAPIAIALRNLSSGSGALGDRYPGVRTVQDSVADLLEVLGRYALPEEASTLGAFLGAVIVVLVAAAAWVAFVRRDRAAMLLGVIVVAYAAAILWGQATTRLDPPSARLLAPIVPLLAIVVVYGITVVKATMGSGASAWADKSSSPWVRVHGAFVLRSLGWGVLAAALAVLAVASVRGDLRLIDAPSGDLRTAASASEVLAAAAAVNADGLASNDPWTTWAALGGPVLHVPPSAQEWPAERIERDAEVLTRGVLSGDVTHMVIFHQDASSWVPPAIDGMRAIEVGTYADGTLYRWEADE